MHILNEDTSSPHNSGCYFANTLFTKTVLWLMCKQRIQIELPDETYHGVAIPLMINRDGYALIYAKGGHLPDAYAFRVGEIVHGKVTNAVAKCFGFLGDKNNVEVEKDFVTLDARSTDASRQQRL